MLRITVGCKYSDLVSTTLQTNSGVYDKSFRASDAQIRVEEHNVLLYRRHAEHHLIPMAEVGKPNAKMTQRTPISGASLHLMQPAPSTAVANRRRISPQVGSALGRIRLPYTSAPSSRHCTWMCSRLYMFAWTHLSHSSRFSH